MPTYLDGHASAVESLGEQNPLPNQALVGRSKLQLNEEQQV